MEIAIIYFRTHSNMLAHLARRGGLVPALTLLVLLAACSVEHREEPDFPWIPDIRGTFELKSLPVILGVDASRNGVIDFHDPKDLDNRHNPEPGFGALFLPNLDDASGRCSEATTDAQREVCYDARLDAVVNEIDLAQMARIRTYPLGEEAPEEAVGSLTIDEASKDRLRIYRRRTGAGEDAADFTLYEPGDAIDAHDLAQGVEFAVEGLSWVEPDKWSGRVELTLSVNVPGRDEPIEDRAHMDVAPLLFPNHMKSAAEVFVADLGRSNDDFRRDLKEAVRQAQLQEGVTELDIDDPWVQDYLLIGYTAIPGPNGPRVMRVYFRSANLNYPGSLEPVYRRLAQMENRPMPTLLREAGAVVYTHFHGPKRAGRAKYHPDKGFAPIDLEDVDVDDVVRYLYGSGSQQSYPHIAEHIERVSEADSLDSFGNTETTPPYIASDGSVYPFGRVYRGHGGEALPDFRPDPTLTGVIEAQGLQPIIWLDTSWLAVAHVDETVSFVPTETERGFSLLHSEPLEAIEILEKVRDEMNGGNALLFEGRSQMGGWWPTPASVTVSEVLDDPDVMAATAKAAVEVAAQVDVFIQEMGLDDDDLVPIPFLYTDRGWGGLSAYQPGMVNGLSLDAGRFGMPRPEGPVIDGVDVFENLVEERLAPLGVQVNWIDSWDVYHVGGGHVHCGTNSERMQPATPWWSREKEP